MDTDQKREKPADQVQERDIADFAEIAAKAEYVVRKVAAAIGKLQAEKFESFLVKGILGAEEYAEKLMSWAMTLDRDVDDAIEHHNRKIEWPRARNKRLNDQRRKTGKKRKQEAE